MNKYILPLFIFMLLLTFTIKSVNADEPGCIGAAFSTTTGAPCNGIPQTTLNSVLLPGCTSNTGYSSTTGTPCDGSPKIIYPYEPTCLPSQGYSTENGLCNTFGRMNPTLIPGCTSTSGNSLTTGESCAKIPTFPSGCNSYAGWSTTTGLSCDGTANTSVVGSVPNIDKQINFDDFKVPGYRVHGCAGGAGLVTTKNNCLYEIEGSSSGKLYSYSQILNSTQVQEKTEFPLTSENLLFPAPNTDLPSSSCVITRTLKIGSSGKDVACLQSYMGLISDGKFGSRTQIAVKAFQANAKLKADGVFGSASIKALGF